MAQIILRMLERLINISHISGVFTAPRAGVYLITFSYEGGEWSEVFMYKDGVKLQETKHKTYYYRAGKGYVSSTGGRAVYQRLKAGSTIHLGTDIVRGNMGHIILCVEFINN